MKSFTIFVLLLLLCFGSANAQGVPEGNSYYARTLPIAQISYHAKGYIVYYIKDSGKMGLAFLPYEWFVARSSAKGIIQYITGPQYPAMSVLYRNGDFYQVRLYAIRQKQHLSWGATKRNPALDKNFTAMKEAPHFEF